MFSHPQKWHSALTKYIKCFTKALFFTLPCQLSGLTSLSLRATLDLPAHYAPTQRPVPPCLPRWHEGAAHRASPSTLVTHPVTDWAPAICRATTSTT